MASYTDFAGLLKLLPSESITGTDGGAFLDRNIAVIDRLLKIGAVLHRHNAAAAIANPITAPVASALNTGGTIPADISLSVGYTWLDANGGETALSGETIVQTQNGLLDPTSAPTAAVSHTAGVLLADTYYYAVSITDGTGGETAVGPAVVVVVPPGNANSRVTISGLTALVTASGGTGWRLWRARAGGNYGLLNAGATDTLIDDGSFTMDCTLTPPSTGSGTTNNTNRIRVTVPAPAPPGVTGFRIYASEGGDFTEQCLLALTYPAAEAGTIKEFASLTFLNAAPPPVSLMIPGASRIDPETEILDFRWRMPVSDLSTLPATGNRDGDVRMTLNDHKLHYWDGDSWELGAGDSVKGHAISEHGLVMPARSALDFRGDVDVEDGPGDRTLIRHRQVDGTLGAWTAVTSVPVARSNHAMVAVGGWLYLSGGVGLATCYRAPINSDGTLGAWAADTALPGVRHSHAMVAAGGWMYVSGGHDGTVARAEVLRAPIFADGSLGTWTAVTSLPAVRHRHAMVAAGTSLYVSGGLSTATCFRASINSDGTLGAWTAVTALPGVRSYHAMVAVGGGMYVSGGSDGTTARAEAYRAPINADGTLGAWAAVTALPSINMGHAMVFAGGWMYLSGGDSPFRAQVSRASVNADGTLGTWATMTPLPVALGYHAMVVVGGWLYAAAGTDGTARAEVYRVPISLEGHIVHDEGVVLPRRGRLDFVGAGVTVTDDEPGERTLVTIPGGGGGGSALTARYDAFVHPDEDTNIVSPAVPLVFGEIGEQTGLAPRNRLRHSSFELVNFSDTWAALVNSTLARSSAVAARSGGFVAALTATAAGDASFQSALTIDEIGGAVPVVPGQIFNAAIYVKPSITRNFVLRIRWYNAAGTFLSQDASGPLSVTSTTTWTRLELGNTAAPASAAFATISPQVNSAAAAEVHYFDDAQFELAGFGMAEWTPRGAYVEITTAGYYLFSARVKVVPNGTPPAVPWWARAVWLTDGTQAPNWGSWNRDNAERAASSTDPIDIYLQGQAPLAAFQGLGLRVAVVTSAADVNFDVVDAALFESSLQVVRVQ